jgi:nucleoside-diphosphate-sugar epimerase
MRILITGNMGYIGPVLTRHLRATFPEAALVGFDIGYFGHCLTGAARYPESQLDMQLFGDVRTLPPEVLDGVDAVVHLAAISNDPMGMRYEKVTHEINHAASARIARMAAERGVKHFVFASSCSMYGSAEGTPRREQDKLDPLTAYARSKAATERDLKQLDNSGMVITSLRFATACGMSDRIRLDLVLNDFVATAVAANQVQVLSDGTPWRPLIDVSDMARAIEWAITRKVENGGAFLAVNAGSQAWNYQVRDLAEAVARAIPGTKVDINQNAAPDKRSYRVDFSLFRELAPNHQPKMTLDASIGQIRAGLEAINFSDPAFRNSRFMRLKVLEGHIAEKRLNEELRWLQ